MSNGCCIACYHCRQEVYLDKIGWVFCSESEHPYLKGYLEVTTHLLEYKDEEWDVGSPELIKWVKTEVTNFLANHQGDLVYMRSDDDIRYTENQRSPSVVLSKEGRQYAQAKGWITALEISPDDQYLAVASYPNILQIYQLSTGELIQEFSTEQETINALVFYSDSRYVASGGKGGTIKAWNCCTGEPLAGSARIDQDYDMTDNSISSLIFLPAQQKLMSSDNYYASILNIWHPQTFENIKRIPAKYRQKRTRLALSPNNKYVGFSPQAIAFSPDSAHLASINFEGESWHTYRDYLKVWDLETQDIILRIPLTEEKSSKVYDLAFSPDGNYLAVAVAEIRQYEEEKEGQAIPDLYWYEENVIKLVNLATREISDIFTGHNGIICSLRFTQDGRSLISGGYDSQIIIWDLESKQISKRQPVSIEPSQSLEMSSFKLSDADDIVIFKV
ncbi:MAG: WD40 repeat domain-containing protein [Microcystaceae cyanobacterium]